MYKYASYSSHCERNLVDSINQWCYYTHAPSKHNVNRVSLTVPNGFAWWNNCTTSRERCNDQTFGTTRIACPREIIRALNEYMFHCSLPARWGDQLNLEWATTFATELELIRTADRNFTVHKHSAYIRRRLYIGRRRLVKPRLRLHECSLYSLTEHAMQRRVDHKLNSLAQPLTSQDKMYT